MPANDDAHPTHPALPLTDSIPPLVIMTLPFAKDGEARITVIPGNARIRAILDGLIEEQEPQNTPGDAT